MQEDSLSGIVFNLIVRKSDLKLFFACVLLAWIRLSQPSWIARSFSEVNLVVWATPCFANQYISLSTPIKSFLCIIICEEKVCLIPPSFCDASLVASSSSASLCILESLWCCTTSLLRLHGLSVNVPTLFPCSCCAAYTRSITSQWQYSSHDRRQKYAKKSLPSTKYRSPPCVCSLLLRYLYPSLIMAVFCHQPSQATRDSKRERKTHVWQYE